MSKTGPGRTAPTWLFNKNGETKLFKTQEEVDQAWEDGWFDEPVEKRAKIPLLSELTWTKRELENLVSEDDRYTGFRVDKRETVDNIRFGLISFEAEHNLIGES